jgi:hypothetical protein
VQKRYRQELALPLGERSSILLPSCSRIEPKDTAVKPRVTVSRSPSFVGKDSIFAASSVSMMEGDKEGVKLS